MLTDAHFYDIFTNASVGWSKDRQGEPSVHVPEVIERQLSAGEKVLWYGRPRQGLVLRASDAF